jgi:predicted Fe-S protein YdhL (DUF1289 family)
MGDCVFSCRIKTPRFIELPFSANIMNTVKTPCIGICSTVFGDEVCRGCKRFVHEVIDWNIYDDDQKRLVKKRLEELSKQVLSSKIIVQDANKFYKTMKLVELDETQSEVILILELLRKAAKQIQNFEEHGLFVLSEYQHYTANELKELIDKEIHILATATYHKDFKSRLGY